uniref:C2H2-type domain-containing protein n=1 Tax=Nothobranchius furzeri TaxID=105023 RepID=A0A8C6M9F0_NOTFU
VKLHVHRTLSHNVSVFPTDVNKMVLVKEEAPEEQLAGVDQKDPEHIHIKEDQDEIWSSLEREQLHLKEETDAARFTFTVVSIKSEDDEEKPLFSQLHQQEIEDRDVSASCSADQMTAETGGGAEASWNQDLIPHEQTSDTSETEISGDEEYDGSDVSTVNKSFSCPDCGKTFLGKQSLQKHARVTGHSAKRSLGCLVKNKCARVKDYVDSCRKVQKELKSFSCDDCGKTFSVKSNFRSHMRVHTGEKPFVCELCGKRLSRKTSLNSHMSVHTGEKHGEFSPYIAGRCI